VKNKNAIIPYEDRRELLLSCRYVDDVFQENSWEQKRDDLQRENASIFAMGDDWIGKFDDLQDVVKVVYLPRTQNVSTTELKTVITQIYDEKLREIRNVASHLNALIDKL
jgi:glycerol-3-phosphate cytidylyltransferase